ncbi:MAG: haloacid dehalogenase-like hydrolase [bacterium]
MQKNITVSKVPSACQTTDLDIPSGSTVFCDMDGTLVDTDDANFLAYRKAVQEATHGRCVLEPTGVRFNRERLKEQLPSLTSRELHVITTLKAEYFGDFLENTRLNTRLAELVVKHRPQCEIILVSGCREERVAQVLKYHNVYKNFARFICREVLLDSDPSRKYETAVELTRVNPTIVFVFENDEVEAKNAEHAGIPRKNIFSSQF